MPIWAQIGWRVGIAVALLLMTLVVHWIERDGLRDYGRLRIVERIDPRGYQYFWFGLGPMIETPSHSTDLEAIADGYVAVTPLHLDLTHGPSLGRLAQLYP